MNPVDKAKQARKEMLLAKKEFYKAAKEYRSIIRSTVKELKATGMSQREIAKKIGISESVLRNHLHPEKRNRNK